MPGCYWALIYKCSRVCPVAGSHVSWWARAPWFSAGYGAPLWLGALPANGAHSQRWTKPRVKPLSSKYHSSDPLRLKGIGNSWGWKIAAAASPLPQGHVKLPCHIPPNFLSIPRVMVGLKSSYPFFCFTSIMIQSSKSQKKDWRCDMSASS